MAHFSFRALQLTATLRPFKPAILHLHGGSSIASSLRHCLPTLQHLAARPACTFVSMENGLAPEHCWNVSLEQNYASRPWSAEQSDRLPIDPSRVATLGKSAGGWTCRHPVSHRTRSANGMSLFCVLGLSNAR
ncbi:alpha/beta hydrolase [Pseudomonas taetrolens]|uniref:alpha/beta hydrolase n=1 Tax=Pseudomonas taetrolens TaxID=47884 RepID=UPI003F9CC76F